MFRPNVSISVNTLVWVRNPYSNINGISRAQLVECFTLWGSGMIDPGLETYQCLFTITWICMAWLPCWSPRGQWMSHQRWIWGFCCMQVMKDASKVIHPDFETQGRCHQKSKPGVSVPDKKNWWSMLASTLVVGGNDTSVDTCWLIDIYTLANDGLRLMLKYKLYGLPSSLPLKMHIRNRNGIPMVGDMGIAVPLSSHALISTHLTKVRYILLFWTDFVILLYSMTDYVISWQVMSKLL